MKKSHKEARLTGNRLLFLIKMYAIVEINGQQFKAH